MIAFLMSGSLAINAGFSFYALYRGHRNRGKSIGIALRNAWIRHELATNRQGKDIRLNPFLKKSIARYPLFWRGFLYAHETNLFQRIYVKKFPLGSALSYLLINPFLLPIALIMQWRAPRDLPPELQVTTEPRSQGRRLHLEDILIYLSGLGGQRGSVNLTDAFRTARLIYHRFDPGLSAEQLRAADRDSFDRFCDAVNRTILLPVGKVLITSDGQKGAWTSIATLQTRRWQKEGRVPSLEVWMAPFKENDFTPVWPPARRERYLFVNEDEISAAAEIAYDELKRWGDPMDLTHTVFERYSRQRPIGWATYNGLFYKSHVIHQFLQRTEDRLFLNEWQTFPLTGAVDAVELAKGLLKPDSLFQSRLREPILLAEEKTDIARAILEVSGLFGGLIRQMRDHLNAEKPGWARFAYFHTLWLVKNRAYDIPWENPGVSAEEVTSLFFKALGDKAAYQWDHSDIPDEDIALLLKSVEEAYREHFYTDQEREDILTASATDLIDPPFRKPRWAEGMEDGFRENKGMYEFRRMKKHFSRILSRAA